MIRPADYWDRRYAAGRDSGCGSRGKSAQAKARMVNALVERERLSTVIDWGCGDGQVLAHITTAVDYVGVDVSATIVERMRCEHPERRFCLGDAPGVTADLALSMDVLQHFLDDQDYRGYLHRLFGSARRLVLIYGTDYDAAPSAAHVRRRRFTTDVADLFGGWTLVEPLGSDREPGFYLYRSGT